MDNAKLEYNEKQLLNNNKSGTMKGISLKADFQT